MKTKIFPIILLSAFILTLAIVSAIAQETTSIEQAPKPTDATACMQAAVEKRDNAMLAGWDATNTQIKAAIIVRRDAVKAAWSNSNSGQRRNSIRAAWIDFIKERKSAESSFRTARKNIWNQFKTDTKNCKVSASYESVGGEVKF